MKICFWVEQRMHTLFECPEDVNEMTKYHTNAMWWWILRDFFVLAKNDFRGYVTFWCLTSEISSAFQISSVYLSLPLFNFKQWKDKSALYSFITQRMTYIMCQVSLVVKYICTCLGFSQELSPQDRTLKHPQRVLVEHFDSGGLMYSKQMWN